MPNRDIPLSSGLEGRDYVPARKRWRGTGTCEDLLMTDWPPREIFPKRRKPHRLPCCEYRKILQPVFFAACTRERRPMLTSDGLPGIVGDLLNGNSARYGCEIIAATLMPDHIHVLAFVSREGGDVLSFFEGFKKGAATVAADRGLPRFWQRNFWDRHTRNEHDLRRCVTYILWNAVEEGLCEHPKDWPYTTFRGWPWQLVQAQVEGKPTGGNVVPHPPDD
jgi:REP element-mobilizing transposase RayT